MHLLHLSLSHQTQVLKNTIGRVGCFSSVQERQGQCTSMNLLETREWNMGSWRSLPTATAEEHRKGTSVHRCILVCIWRLSSYPALQKEQVLPHFALWSPHKNFSGLSAHKDDLSPVLASSPLPQQRLWQFPPIGWLLTNIHWILRLILFYFELLIIFR